MTCDRCGCHRDSHPNDGACYDTAPDATACQCPAFTSEDADWRAAR